MNDTPSPRPPKWYWIVATLALLWNLVGCLMWSIEMFAQQTLMESMTDQQQEWVRSIPRWIYGAYAAAVTSGVAGSLGLLLQKSWARALFAISLVLVVIQMLYPTLIAGGLRVMGPESLIMPVIVIGIAILLLWFSSLARSNSWLDQ